MAIDTALPPGHLMAALAAVAALAAIVLACYAPRGGEPLRPFLVVAACALVGGSAGGAAWLVSRDLTRFPPYLFGFLGCVLAALIVATIYALRRR